MPNPPTFNDLKRLRTSSKNKLPSRVKITSLGVVTFTIPKLPTPQFDILATEDLIFEVGTEDYFSFALYNDSYPFIYLDEIYNNYDITVSPSSYSNSQKINWFFNDKFISQSRELNIKVTKPGLNKVKADYYSDIQTITSSEFNFTSYDFDLLNVNLSADNISISKPFDNIATSINFKNILNSGKFLDGRVQFQIDYGDGENVSDVFDSLNVIKTNAYTFSSPITGTKTITLSTIRSDDVYGLNETFLTINFDINESFIYRSRLDSIHTTWQTISGIPNPEGEEDKFRFLNNPTNTSAEWNTEWWGYNSRDLYNFSGVTYKATGFSSENNITLITPKHGVCNEHWGDDPRAGDVGFFYDHTTGNAISAEIVSAFNTDTSDIRMVKFDRDLTAEGNIKVYKLPLLLNPLGDNVLCTIYQGGNGPYGTGSSDRHAGLGTHRDVLDVQGIDMFSTEVGATDLWQVSSVFDGTYFSLSSLAVGDSSSPTFIIHDNDILLASTFYTGGGGGPNYALSGIQSILSAGLETLGNSEGYTLSTIELS